jgi:NAD(P)-dependent dehydrogenase (short-subunit alcohol dehydrogenase family)
MAMPVARSTSSRAARIRPPSSSSSLPCDRRKWAFTSTSVTGSTAGSTGTPAFSVYAASKAAIRNFSRNWILDLKDRGIRIHTLSPGPTETTGLVELAGQDKAQQQGLLDLLAGQVPMGRVGRAEEIAAAALFLASDDSSFVTGAELFADGGIAQV